MNKLTMKSSVCMFMFVGFSVISNASFSIGLNYDQLSFVEEPIASHNGDTTVELLGLVDLAGDFSDDAEESSIVTSALELGLEKQLVNSKTLGARFFADYQSDLYDAFEANASAYYAGVWGEISVGGVAETINQLTDRNTAVGKSKLAFNGLSGDLPDLGIAYRGRIGPSQYAVGVDQDGKLSLGGVFQRPIEDKDYRFAINLVNGEFASEEDNPEVNFLFETTHVNFISELTYGSSIIDFGFGIESFDSDERSFDRNYLTAGLSHKFGRLALSAQFLKGDVDGFDQSAYALGAQYDIARGMAFNVAINQSSSDLDKSDLSIQSVEKTEQMLSLSYRF